MVVSKLDVMRFAVEPAKAESPLIVDANAMLTFAVGGQFLQAIAWRNSQVFQRFGGIKQRQLTKCGALQFSSEFFDSLAPEESLCVLVREAPYHRVIIAPGVINVKRYATHKLSGLKKQLTCPAPHLDSIGQLLIIKGPAWVEERREARERGALNNLELRKLAAYPLPGTQSESVVLGIRPKGD